MVDWGQGAQGAAGGAMAGSFAGPVGTAIGGVAGGLMGLFGGSGAQGYQDQLKQLAGQYGGRNAPQGQAVQAGSSQAGLVAQLQAMAQGSGPSAAALQMREAMDRAAGAQMSAAAGAGGRGVNAGAALRNASNNTAQVQAQGARDTGQMRVNEQLGALQQLQGIRGQDIGLNEFNAGGQNQMTQANMQSQLTQQQMNAAQQLQALQLAMGGAGPGTGASLMAGGAQAMPGILQYLNMQGRAQPGGTGAPTSAFSWGQSGSQYT